MKFRCYLYSILFVFCIVSVWAQESRPRQITNVKVGLKLSSTPIYKIQNIQNSAYTNDRWLIINLAYVPSLRGQAVPTSSTFNMKEEFKIKFEAIIPNLRDKKTYLLSTTVSYWPINFDGKKHQAMALIPPNILNKITSSRINNTFLQERVKVKITFFYNNKMLKEVFSPAVRVDTNIAGLFKTAASSSDFIKLKNAIFNRDKTPWMLINFDRFELIKQ